MADQPQVSIDEATRVAALEEWNAQMEAAEEMVPILGRLYRKQNVVATVFGKSLMNLSAVAIIQVHKYATRYLGAQLSLATSASILGVVANQINVAPIRLDLGKMAAGLADAGVELEPSGAPKDPAALEAYLAEALSEATAPAGEDPAPLLDSPQDVVLFGFGRVGRLVARVLLEKTGGGHKLLLRAVVVRPKGKDDLVKRASLLRRDSVHGHFHGTITYDEAANVLVANGNVIQVIFAESPSEIDYTEYGIENAILVDNTGKWRDGNGLALHRACPGVGKVVLTAPASGSGVTTVVAGINDDRVVPEVDLYAAASCTTNAIVPILKAVHDEFGIENGHVETVHSFTNDQNLIDGFHKKARRGRSAPANLVITETGAAKAVSKSLPEFEGKLTGNAIRVPTPDVSLAILILRLERDGVTTEDVNEYLRACSMRGPLSKQIDFTASTDVASSDFVGNRAAGVVDSAATMVSGDRRVNLYVWYDNEFGYSCQVVRLIQRIAGINHPRYPDDDVATAAEPSTSAA